MTSSLPGEVSAPLTAPDGPVVEDHQCCHRNLEDRGIRVLLLGDQPAGEILDHPRVEIGRDPVNPGHGEYRGVGDHQFSLSVEVKTHSGAEDRNAEVDLIEHQVGVSEAVDPSRGFARVRSPVLGLRTPRRGGS